MFIKGSTLTKGPGKHKEYCGFGSCNCLTGRHRDVLGRHRCACSHLAVGRSYNVRPHHAAPTPIHWLKVPRRIDNKLAVLVYKCLHGLAPSYTSRTNFTIQQSRSFEGVCVPLRLINCLFPVPDSQRRPSFSSRRRTDLEQSSAALSHLLRHFPSSVLA